MSIHRQNALHSSLTLRIAVLLTLIASLVLPSSAAARLRPEELCLAAARIVPSETFRAEGLAAGEPTCFRLEVPAAGVVMLDVVVPGAAHASPRLGLASCAETAGFHVLGRTPGHTLLQAETGGELTFCVGAQDPRHRLGAYKLRTVFAAREGEDTLENPEEIEAEPEGAILPAPTAPTPAGLDRMENPEEIEAEPEGFRLAPSPALCRTSALDDHADVPACATLLHLGEMMRGRIANAWGDDHDLFAFDLLEEGTVRLRIAGDDVPEALLIDDRGRRLETMPVDAPGRARLVRTLPAGRYFLRLEARDHREGEYALLVDVLPASW